MNEIKVPCGIIHDKSLGNKRVIAFTSILFNAHSDVDYKEITTFAKYSCFRGKDGAMNQFKKIIEGFFSAGYLSKENNKIISVSNKEQFGVIYGNEFAKILDLHEEYKKHGKRLNHANVLLLLSYIRLYMNYNNSIKPRFYSNLLIRISNGTGLSVRTISHCLKVLEELHIVHNEALPRYKGEDGVWHTNSRVFIDYYRFGNIPYNWKYECSKSKKYILGG